MSILSFCGSARQTFGAEAEGWVWSQLTQRGIKARVISDWSNCFDLVIDDRLPLPVEVKAARRRRRQVRPGYYAEEYRWHLGNIPQDQDFLLALVAEDDRGDRFLYLVPSWAAFGRVGISITSHPERYAGRLAKYLDNWQVIDQVTRERSKRCKHGQQFSFADYSGVTQ